MGPQQVLGEKFAAGVRDSSVAKKLSQRSIKNMSPVVCITDMRLAHGVIDATFTALRCLQRAPGLDVLGQYPDRVVGAGAAVLELERRNITKQRLIVDQTVD